jgi:hypothetical protein
MIELTEPATIELYFNTPPECVYISDLSGDIHYFRLNVLEPKIVINANITVAGDYIVEPAPNGYVVKKLKKFTRNFTLQKQELNVEKEPVFIYKETLTGTPARCFQDTGIIEYSGQFMRLPYYVRCFILCHELGHFYYNTEHLADEFAIYHYCNGMGFNPCCALSSINDYLSNTDLNVFRMEKAYFKILSIQE